MVYKNLTPDEITQLEFQAGKKTTEIVDKILGDNAEIVERVCNFTDDDNGKILQVGADGKIVALESSEGLTIDPTLTVANSAADAKAVGDELTSLKSALNNISVKSKNLMPIAGKSVSFSDVDVSYSDGVITINGTATGDGGRLNKLTELFTLGAGTYYVTATNSTGATAANVVIQDSSNTVIALLNNNRTTFTLNAQTQLFLGVSVTSGATYDYTVNIQLESDAYTDWTAPSQATAIDSVARGNDEKIYSLFGGYAKPTVTFTSGIYINYTSGETGSLSGNSASDYIPVSSGENISISGYSSSAWNDTRGLAYYDENHAYLSGVQMTGSAMNIIIPANVSYMRITVETAYTGTYTLGCTFGNMISEVGSLISKSNGQSTDPSIAMFEKVGFCGDSYVKGQIYNASGVIGDFPEIAWGSDIGRLCGVDAQIFASSGADTSSWQSRSDCLPALLDAQNPCGLYIFCLGINDASSVTLGSMDDITDFESYTEYPDTFYGNYGKIIEQVLGYSQSSRIILMTPFHPSYNARYVTPLTEIAEHYGIAMIDTTKSSLCNSAFASALVGGHPTSVQHSQMASNILGLISDCIKDNADYFAAYHGV